jgi:hypothetical protein
MQPESTVHQVTCLCEQRHECNYPPGEIIRSLEKPKHSFAGRLGRQLWGNHLHPRLPRLLQTRQPVHVPQKLGVQVLGDIGPDSGAS